MTKTVKAITQARADTSVLSIIAAAILGITLIGVAGHVQAAALHDAAHDMRHATGFPCH